MNKRITRKLCIVGLISSIVLSGCGNAGITGGNREELSGGTDKVVSLKVWTEKDGLDVMNKMLDSFKEQYKDEAEFDITVEIQADSQVRDVMLTDVHNGADVFSFPDDQIISLTAGGVLTEVPNADEIAAANVKESVEAATLNDTLYGYPMTADNGYFLYYNKKYFSGNDVKKLDTILAKAEKVHKKVTMDWTSAWYLYSFFGNTGLKAGVNEDGVTNYCNWNSKKGKIKGIDVAQAMERIAGSSAFLNTTDDKFLKGVQNGSVIAGVSGVWNANAIDKAWGKNYGAVKLPTYTCAGKQVQMASFTGYKMVGVNAYSSDVKWAMKLAEWITNQDNQTRRFAERGQGPSNIKASQSGDIEKSPAIQAVIAQSEYGCLQRVGGNFWDPISSFGSSVANGTLSPKELQKELDDMVKKVTAPTV